MSEQAFWASDYRFLNDISEFKYGWSILSKQIERASSQINTLSKDAHSLLSNLHGSMEQSKAIGFVASFSEHGDLLSQWRGYNGGRGYSLGIDRLWLAHNAATQGFSLFSVTYDQEEQERSAEKSMNLLFDLIQSAVDRNESIKDVVDGWWEHALKTALSFKDKNFVEEKEQRLALITRHWPKQISIRSGMKGLIPYIPCYFNRSSPVGTLSHPNNSGLEEIIVGPSLHSDQSYAIDALQARYGMRFLVRKSQIPYAAD